MHGGYDRLPAREVLRDPAEGVEVRVGVRLAGLAVLCHVLEVIARAEGPLPSAAEDGHEHVVVVPKVGERLPHLPVPGGVQSVQVGLPVQRNVGDAFPLLIQDMLEVHVRLLQMMICTRPGRPRSRRMIVLISSTALSKRPVRLTTT